MLRRAAINDLSKIIYLLDDIKEEMEVNYSITFPYDYDIDLLSEKISNGHIYVRGVGTDIAGIICIGNDSYIDSLDIKWSRNLPSTTFYMLVINKRYRDKNIEEELILLVENISINHRLKYIKGITYEKFPNIIKALDNLNYNLIGKVFLDNKDHLFYCYEKNL